MIEQDDLAPHPANGNTDPDEVRVPTASVPRTFPTRGGHRTDVCRAFKMGGTDTSLRPGQPGHPQTCDRCLQPFAVHGQVPLNRDQSISLPTWSVLVSKIEEPGTYAETTGYGYFEGSQIAGHSPVTPVAFSGDAEAMNTIRRWLEWVQMANQTRGVNWPLMAFVRRADILVEADPDSPRLTSAVYVGPGVRPLPDRAPLLKTGQGLIVRNAEVRVPRPSGNGDHSTLQGWADPLDPYAEADWGDQQIVDIPMVDVVLNSNWRTRAR
jgi:hypothetical protein